MNILTVITNYLAESGFGQFSIWNGVMILIGLLFIFLAIRKGFEPLLLVPIGFGILIGNIPYNSQSLPLSVYDGPVSQKNIAVYASEDIQVQSPVILIQDRAYNAYGRDLLVDGKAVAHDAVIEVEPPTKGVRGRTTSPVTLGGKEVPIEFHVDAAGNPMATEVTISRNDNVIPAGYNATSYGFQSWDWVEEGRAIMVNKKSLLTSSIPEDADFPLVVELGQGRAVYAHDYHESNKYPEVWSTKKQDTFNASVMYFLYSGVGFGFFPPLIFLGIGALTDFGPMLSNPKTLLLGAAAQFGIFGALLGAVAIFGFNMKEAASIGIIGGADGPTAIFTCSQLAPHLLGAVALAAYSYMAMVPIIQPPIVRLLTNKHERLIRMPQHASVSKTTKIIFPIAAFLLTAMIAPGGLPLLGMLFFGNLLRESLVTDRLAKTAQSSFIDIVTILLGVTVGAKTSAEYFLTYQTIFIFILGILAFGIATASGVLFGKLLNWLSKEPINPMIGAAGVSAVPMAARVVHKMGQEEDPQNFLLMHAMGPNVAGVIGSAVAAGVLLSWLAG